MFENFAILFLSFFFLVAFKTNEFIFLSFGSLNLFDYFHFRLTSSFR